MSLALFRGRICAQEEVIENPINQIEFQHDNDFVMLTDRYYSSGLFLTYRRYMKSGIFKQGNEQWHVQLLQEAYTPSDIDAFEIQNLDRPYAGYSGLHGGWSIARDHLLIRGELQFGFTGPSSGAGAFQRWYHRAIVRYSEPTWFTEIEDSFHSNFQLDVVTDWEWSPNPFSVHFALAGQVSFGTRAIHVQPEAILYFGRRNPLPTSIAYNRVHSTQKEIYFAFRLGYRVVWHNAFLEGNALGDNSEYTIEPRKNLLITGFEVFHRFTRNGYKFGYRRLPKEADEVNPHQYLILSYSRSF